MSSYLLLPKAQLDLTEIWQFIASDDADAADRIETELLRAFQALATNPRVRHYRRDLTTKELRFWAVRKYLIVYRAETRPVEIVAVLHGARNVLRILNERLNV